MLSARGMAASIAAYEIINCFQHAYDRLVFLCAEESRSIHIADKQILSPLSNCAAIS